MKIFSGKILVAVGVLTVCALMQQACLGEENKAAPNPASKEVRTAEPARRMPDPLVKAASEMMARFAGDPQRAKESWASHDAEIDKKYWPKEIADLKPIRVYSHMVNIAIVLKEENGKEVGKYVILPISSYAPRNGNGFTFKPEMLPGAASGTIVRPNVMDYERVKEPSLLTLKLIGVDGKPAADKQTLIGMQVGDRYPRLIRWSDMHGIIDIPASLFAVVDLTDGKPNARCELMVVGIDAGWDHYGPWYLDQRREIELRLQPMGSIVGQVSMDPGGGGVVSDAAASGAGVRVMAVRISPEDFGLNREIRAQCDEKGKFVIPDMVPGEWLVCASEIPNSQSNLNVQVKGGSEPTKVSLVVKVVQQQPYVTVEGIVVGADGKPMSGAVIETHPKTHEGMNMTGDDGKFTLERCERGTTYNLTATNYGFATVRRNLTVPKETAPEELKIVIKAKGATISGKVFDADEKKPLAGERVVALNPADPNFRTQFNEEFMQFRRLGEFESSDWFDVEHYLTVTDDAGAYKIEDLAEGEYAVFLIRNSGINLRKPDILVREGKATADVNFEVTRRPEGFLTGKLLEADGKPMPNASACWKYSAKMENNRHNGTGGIKSDEDGWYYWKLPGAGSYEATAFMEGYEPVALKFEVKKGETPPTQDMLFKVQSPKTFGALEGTVFLPDGKTPAVGAYVIPYTPDNVPFVGNGSVKRNGETLSFSQDKVVSTDAKGIFRIPDLLPGKYGVIISPTRGLGRREAVAEELQQCLLTFSEMAEVKESSAAQLTVKFDLAGRIAGVVTDKETGAPMADAQLGANYVHTGSGNMPPFGGGFNQTKSDTDGKFMFTGLFPGTYSLSGNLLSGDKEYNVTGNRTFAVAAGKETSANLALERRKFGKVLVLVLKPDGSPAPDAKLRWSLMDRNAMTVPFQDGRYIIEKMNVGSSSIVAEADGFARSQSPTFSVEDGKTTEVTVKLSTGGFIEGKVMTFDGKPAAKALVILMPPTMVRMIPESQLRQPWTSVLDFTTAGDDGSFAFKQVPETLVTIWAQNDERVLDAKKDLLVKSGETLKLELREVKADSVLRGRVTGPDGKPVAGIKLAILPVGMANFARQNNPITREDGTYEAKGLAAGSYLVACSTAAPPSPPSANTRRVEPAFLVRNPVKVENETTLDFALTNGGTLTGTVLDKAGKPVARAMVTTMFSLKGEGEAAAVLKIPDGSGLGMAQTDENGKFTIEHLPAGNYPLQVRAQGFKMLALPANNVVKDGEVAELKIELEAE